jgi:hypothetical protein
MILPQIRAGAVALIALAAFHGPAGVHQGQNAREVWEKPIAPGLVYRMEYDPVRPMVLNGLRLTLKAPSVRAEPVLAGGTVYEDGPTKGRGTVTQMVAENHALAGINGDYFPFTGHPLGLMVHNGELLGLPRKNRAVFAWGPNDLALGLAKYTGSFKPEGGDSTPIDGLNEECPDNSVVLNMSVSGYAIAPKRPSIAAVLKVNTDKLAPSTELVATVEYLVPDADRTPVKAGTAMLVAEGDKIPAVTGLKAGQQVSLNIQTEGFDWEHIDNCVGGGPILLRDGKVLLDDEGFDKVAFVDKQHPRSAIGRTANGDMWFVTIDGRQETGSGVSLTELANEMKRLGCVDAMNLDGGGSSAINILGVLVNRPSDGIERPVANGIVLFGPQPRLSDVQLHLIIPKSLDMNTQPYFEVRDAGGQKVPNREVIWGAMGAGWLDQGGLFHPLRPGKAHIQAAARGQVMTADVDVSKGN